ncbi:unnamed protein product [Acanthoscelides obtectus]|uniref:Innexin n=1 Tax=Acanthoscelides obtectus TaxID=200917 RepID=A0A9P0L6Z8_ACAOB|nr:unnamed protein product [Acanthoscelides obtectus]CAK1635931.1 Innexin inx7 [Acanthoscelides obtectus]
MSLVQTFGVIKSNFKLKPKEYTIDNWAFKMHYKATVLFFLVSTILVTSRQYIGEHIRCIADGGVPAHVINTFCFFTSTFTVVKHLDAKLIDSGGLAHPGVGPYGINSTEPVKRHAYYQWVPFVLFGQAICFYLTHLLWKKMEGGRIRYIVDGLKLAAFALQEKELQSGGKTIPSKKDKEEKIKKLREFFLKRVYINNFWSYKLIGIEVLNFLHVILQIYITNKFLSGNFRQLGSEVWSEGLDSSVDVLDEVFPKITKCTFHKYGPSGSIQLHDAMCVMALNIINEKIYVALWFWFLFLFIASLAAVLWRFLTLALHARSVQFNRMVFGVNSPGKLNPWDTLTVTRHCNFSDWLFLSYLAKNLDSMVFREIFVGLAEEIEGKKPNKERLLNESDGEVDPDATLKAS